MFRLLFVRIRKRHCLAGIFRRFETAPLRKVRFLTGRATIRGFASKPSPALAFLVRIFLFGFFIKPVIAPHTNLLTGLRNRFQGLRNLTGFP